MLIETVDLEAKLKRAAEIRKRVLDAMYGATNEEAFGAVLGLVVELAMKHGMGAQLHDMISQGLRAACGCKECAGRDTAQPS